MCVLILILALLVTIKITSAQRGAPCTTPNSEIAKCIPSSECDAILNAVKTQNTQAIKFAQKSLCGYDSEPLICCGSMYSSSLNDSDQLTTSTLGPKTEIINLRPLETSDLPDRTVCGLEKVANRIVGGHITDIDEFPWMAALESIRTVVPFDIGVRCGGSLINPRYVVTAAHCIKNKEFNVTTILLGEWNLETDPDCLENDTINQDCGDPVERYSVEELIAHPYYSPRSGDDDVALIRLGRDVDYTDYIRPICLPSSNLPSPEFGSIMTVAGWGLTESGQQSSVKLKLSIPLLKNEICNQKLGNDRQVTVNQLCAGGKVGMDSCQGDSGGPLMRLYADRGNRQAQWYQEGVVSWGVGCARQNRPAVYTRVSRYINWILREMANSS